MPSAILGMEYLSKPPEVQLEDKSTLSGFTESQVLPAFTIANWWSGEYQDQFSDWFAKHFAGREKYIRASNQMYYTLFRKSYMYNQSIIVGKGNQLFEKPYIDDYINEPAMDNQQIEEMLDRIAQVQRLLEQRGIAFVVLITPSKAYTYPEFLPSSVQNYQRTISNYERIIPLLKESGIHFVDGQQITLELKESQPYPLFCQGGTHWNDIAALESVWGLDALVKDITNWNTVPLKVSQQYVDNNPDSIDKDLASLLNLLDQEWSYPAPHITLHRNDSTSYRRPKVVMVGGSFSDRPINFLTSSGWTNSLDFYSYYIKQLRFYPVDRGVAVTIQPRDASWWNQHILSKDLIILEINQIQFDGNHVRMFLEDALEFMQE